VPSITRTVTDHLGKANDDGNYGSAGTRDIECLQAISRRIHCGAFSLSLSLALSFCRTSLTRSCTPCPQACSSRRASSSRTRRRSCRTSSTRTRTRSSPSSPSPPSRRRSSCASRTRRGGTAPSSARTASPCATAARRRSAPRRSSGCTGSTSSRSPRTSRCVARSLSLSLSLSLTYTSCVEQALILLPAGRVPSPPPRRPLAGASRRPRGAEGPSMNISKAVQLGVQYLSALVELSQPLGFSRARRAGEENGNYESGRERETD